MSILHSGGTRQGAQAKEGTLNVRTEGEASSRWVQGRWGRMLTIETNAILAPRYRDGT